MTYSRLLFQEIISRSWIDVDTQSAVTSWAQCKSDGVRTWFFDAQNIGKREKALEADLKDESKNDDWLYCAACKKKITQIDERINVLGTHSHNFTNPHGYGFHIGCFQNASGCISVGEETTAHSWFPGHTWRIALCAQCRNHLGWRFYSSGNIFYGLILNQMVTGHRH